VVKPLLDEAERARVRAAVEAAERTTAGEIRVLVVERSAGPDLAVGLVAGLAAAAGAWAAGAREAWGHPGLFEAALAAAIGVGAGALAAWAAGRLGRARAVLRRAEREFVRLGIAATAGRTGVLIMLSAAERRAVILADRAVNEKVAPGTWEEVVSRLAATAREGRLAAGLEEAVARVGGVLARHFPRGDGDVNELPDDVELRR
jgi:putative membrane protein